VLVHLFFAISYSQLQTERARTLFFGRIGIFVLLGIVLTHIMRILINRFDVMQLKPEKQAAFFIFLTVIFSLICASLDIHLLSLIGLLSPAEQENIASGKLYLVLLGNTTYVFTFYFIWNLIYFLYHYITRSQQQQVNTLELESVVKGLKLKTIKAHINPHFIFNSLNSIRTLVHESPEKARKAITELSNILRSSINADKHETTLFKNELTIVQDYLGLEKMRFEERLDLTYDIHDYTLDLPVPPMILQVLVENAIRHGIGKQTEGGVIRIVSGIRNGCHELTVQNTGQLTGDMKGNGFGLSGTVSQLQLLYGDKSSFSIWQARANLVEARICIPLTSDTIETAKQ